MERCDAGKSKRSDGDEHLVGMRHARGDGAGVGLRGLSASAAFGQLERYDTGGESGHCANERAGVRRGSTTFTLSGDSCCEVEWSLTPTNAGGAYIASGGGCGIVVKHGTNCGSYLITARTRLPGLDCGTIWQPRACCDSATLTVARAAISPAIAEAQINRCKDPYRAVNFCVDANCCVGEAIWSLEPELPDGATISGNGACATVEIGNVETNYTIRAACTANTNCVGTAMLRVSRDCECTNHVFGGIYLVPTGGMSCGGTNNPWNGPVTNSPCGQTAQLVCTWCNQANSNCSSNATCFIFYFNGNDVGHCLYSSSSVFASFYKCRCGDVFLGSYWWIVNDLTGNGYWLETVCGRRNGPNCFDSSGQPRSCNGGCDDY